MDTQKNAHFKRLHICSQNLSEKIASQFILVKDLIKEKHDEEYHQKIEENEQYIDQMENQIRVDFSNYILLYTPRTKDLRKVITYQDITNFQEHIGDLLLQASIYLRKIDHSSSDFSDLLLTLEKLFIRTKDMVDNLLYAFYSEDKAVANKMIDEYAKIVDSSAELTDNLLLEFQGIELEEGELNNMLKINNVNLLICEIAKTGSNIAEAIIYLIDGLDIRHRKKETIEL